MVPDVVDPRSQSLRSYQYYSFKIDKDFTIIRPCYWCQSTQKSWEFRRLARYIYAAPEINISPVLDIVCGSRHFVPVTSISCQSSVYDIMLKFENMPVIVTGRKWILSVTYEIVLDSDRWPAVISCTDMAHFASPLLLSIFGIIFIKIFNYREGLKQGRKWAFGYWT